MTLAAEHELTENSEAMTWLLHTVFQMVLMQQQELWHQGRFKNSAPGP